MTAYTFDGQLAHGAQGEAALDAFFAAWFTIAPATPAQQRRGIDRIFTPRQAARRSERLAVEYKTDSRAGKTGNAFVELVSQDWSGSKTPRRPAVKGWAYTCAADYLVYYVTGGDADAIYIVKPALLRRELPRWARTYPARAVPNASGYATRGLLVPLRELERIAQAVY